MRKVGKALLIAVGVFAILDALETALMMWGFRHHNERALRYVRIYNKRVANPIMLLFSGRRGLTTGTVHHVGRRSGKAFATPVLAHRTGGEILIPLPYGTKVDWVRNLTVAGRGSVDVDGRTYSVDQPRIVGTDEAAPMMPRSMVRISRLHHTREALRLRASAAT